MTTDAELVAYALSLEQRVDRLKTLEDVGAGGGAMVFITSSELAIASASLTISSIPQLYTDLFIIYRCRTARAVAQDYLIGQFNGDTTGGNYDTARQANNARNTCFKDSGFVMFGIVPGATAVNGDDYGSGICLIPEYTSTVQKKSTEAIGGFDRQSATLGINGQCVGSWNQYSAITSIKFYSWAAANLLADTYIELYGLTR
jgi:hypothetical protein